MANGRKDGIARAVAAAKETMLGEGQAPRVPNRHRRDRGPSHGTVVVVAAAAGIIITVREAAVVVLSSSRHRYRRRMWSFMVPHDIL